MKFCWVLVLFYVQISGIRGQFRMMNKGFIAINLPLFFLKLNLKLIVETEKPCQLFA